MKAILRVLFSLSLLLNSGTFASFAQQTVAAATVSGRVEDAGGAAISGALIKVTSLEQKQVFSATSDDRGRYRFAYLPVDNYQLQITQAGFMTLEQNFTLTVGQALDIPLKLTVAGASESITVTSDVPVIETVRTQTSETVVPQEINSLPLNRRNYLDLAALT